MERSELVAQLIERIDAGDQTPLAKAIDAATLSLLDADRGIEPHLLDALGYDDRALVERYHQVLTLITDELIQGASSFDRTAIDARLDELFGHQPIKIRTVELCRRVMGYGIYEPFEGHTFLAGSDQKAIVYIELDHFQAMQTDQDRYEVKLEQEIALFNEADGLAVWRSDPVQITDLSRNRRRDFFVVQLVTLPARLSVGKYRLKVRITDLHGGSIDEQTLPLEIVADPALVRNDEP